MSELLRQQDEWTITVKQWASVCRCSIDSAERDIKDLVTRGLLARNQGGSLRTSYRFAWTPT